MAIYRNSLNIIFITIFWTFKALTDVFKWIWSLQNKTLGAGFFMGIYSFVFEKPEIWNHTYISWSHFHWFLSPLSTSYFSWMIGISPALIFLPVDLHKTAVKGVLTQCTLLPDTLCHLCFWRTEIVFLKLLNLQHLTLITTGTIFFK